MSERQIHFGDVVRVKESEETIRIGLAGKKGDVHGETMPSITGISVIGEPLHDFAVSVYFEELDTSHWFAEELLELLHYGAGSEIKLDGVPKKWVRSETGEWIEHDLEKGTKRPWWKLW